MLKPCVQKGCMFKPCSELLYVQPMFISAVYSTCVQPGVQNHCMFNLCSEALYAETMFRTAVCSSHVQNCCMFKPCSQHVQAMFTVSSGHVPCMLSHVHCMLSHVRCMFKPCSLYVKPCSLYVQAMFTVCSNLVSAAAQAVTNGDPLQQYATIQPYASIGQCACLILFVSSPPPPPPHIYLPPPPFSLSLSLSLSLSMRLFTPPPPSSFYLCVSVWHRWNEPERWFVLTTSFVFTHSLPGLRLCTSEDGELTGLCIGIAQLCLKCAGDDSE